MATLCQYITIKMLKFLERHKLLMLLEKVNKWMNSTFSTKQIEFVNQENFRLNW